MNKWIEINIPFGPIYNDKEVEPNFSKEFLAQEAKFQKKIDDVGECDIGHWLNVLGNLPDNKNEKEALEKIAKTDEKIEKYLIKREKEKEMDNFLDSNKEWNKYWDAHHEFIKAKNNQDDSMAKRSLIHPGTLIETEGGDQYLIGDINTRAGVCDDCRAFDNETIIRRYKIIWERESEKNIKNYIKQVVGE